MVTVRLDIKPLASDTSVRPTGETLPAGGELSPAQEAVDTLTGTKGGFQKKYWKERPFLRYQHSFRNATRGAKTLVICFYLATAVFLLESLDERGLPLFAAYRVSHTKSFGVKAFENADRGNQENRVGSHVADAVSALKGKGVELITIHRFADNGRSAE